MLQLRYMLFLAVRVSLKILIDFFKLKLKLYDSPVLY